MKGRKERRQEEEILLIKLLIFPFQVVFKFKKVPETILVVVTVPVVNNRK